MPVGFSSAARNLFLLGSSGADAVTNFFKAIDKSSNPNEGYYTPSQIKYNYSDGKFLLSGTGLGNDSFGWVEKRDYDGSNSTSTEEWGVRISPAVYSSALTLTTMELDGNDNVIVVGKYGGVNGNYGTEAPYIAKYSNAGVLDWQSTSSTGDLEYTGVTSDSSGNYYACGNTPDTQISASGSDIAIAYVEKFDSNGNPGWGKAASMPNRDAVLTKIASNNKGAVIAVGYLEDDSAKKGYIVKIDSSTGEVLWDRTIKSQYDPDGLNSYQDVECKDIFIDSSGQIYIVGNKFNHGFIIKYTAEGNIIWQKQTDEGLFTNFTFEQVFSDGETEQAVVFGTASGGLGTKRGLLSKYSKNGDLVWRRFLESSRDSGLQFDNVSLDADPSFYYLLFCDQVTSGMNPTKYTFGKVSTSGNGLGDFQYSSDGSTTIDYKILNAPDQIGRLSDGSVSNSSSDLMSYPFTANKLLFDDLATNISNKKRQMDGPDSFEYSGSPAIRVNDFQEMNLLGDADIPETPPVELITNGGFENDDINGWTLDQNGGNVIDFYNSGYTGSRSLTLQNLGGSGNPNFYQSFATEPGKTYRVTLKQSGSPTFTILDGSGVSGTTLLTMITTNPTGSVAFDEEAYFKAASTTSTIALLGVPGAPLLDDISVKRYLPTEVWSDQSGKGNDAIVPGIWIKTLGSAAQSGFGNWSQACTIDNNYFYTSGMVQSEGQGGRDAYISKWYFDGSLVWQKIIGLAGFEQFTAIEVDPSGNVYGIGVTNSIVSGTYSLFVAKFDSNGSVVWQKIYGGDSINPVIPATAINYSGNIIISKRVGNSIGGVYSTIKIDTDGNIIWEYEYSNAINPTILNSDNSFYSLATYSDGSYEISLVSSDGSILSQSTFGIDFPIDQILSMQRRPNGNFVFAGRDFDDSATPRTSTMVLFEYDSQLNPINNKSYTENTIGYHYLTKLTLDSKGNLYGTGLRFNSSVGATSYDPLVFKINTDLEIEWAVVIDGISTNLDLVYGIDISPDYKHIYITGFWKTSSTYTHNHFKIRTDTGISPGTYGDIIVSNHSYSGPTTENFPAGTRITPTITKSATSLSVSNTSMTSANSSLPITTQLDINPIYNAAGYWEFDGVDDYIQVPTINSTIEKTYSIWATLPASGEQQVFSIGNSSSTCIGLTFNSTRDGNSQVVASSSNYGSVVTTGSYGVSSGITTGWHNFTITTNSSGNITALYIDAVSYPSRTEQSRVYISETTTRIGDRSDGNFTYSGSVGDILFYPRALTAAQVYQNYNATQEKYTDLRPNTSPMIGPSIASTSNLKLNYDFGNNFCIEKSSNVSSYEFILDDATTNGASFGDTQSVATGYGKVVVGARGENCTASGYTYTAGGKAFIYNSSTGVLETTLVASDIAGNDWNFGNSVSICNCSGKIAVTSNNALYLYDADGTNEIIINESSTLPITPPGGNTFGNGLAISGNRVWVSDHNVPTGPDYSGTVYCFNVETGALLYELRPKNTFNNFRIYGKRIAAGGGKLAIGAESISHPVTGRSAAGRVYLYDVDGRNEKILEPDTLTTSSLFGVDGIAIDHGMIVVGASRQQRIEDPLENGSGEVYVFDMKGDLDFSIRPSDDPANEDIDGFGFGSSVAVSSDRIIVGARYYAGNAGGVAGRAYQFTHKGKELQSWFGSGGADASSFGSSMDAVGGTLVIGAGSGSPDSSGRAYVYPLTGTPSGKVLNLSSSPYTGTINSGATFNPAGYFEFDGVDGRLETTLPASTIGQTFTAEVWIYPTDFSAPTGSPTDAYPRRIMSCHRSVGSTKWCFGIDTSGRLGFGGAQGVEEANDKKYQLSLNTYYHVVLVHNGTSYKIYVNGTEQVDQTTSSIDPNNQSNLAISGRPDGYTDRVFEGRIAEVRMYTTALDSTKVSQNFNATKSKYGL